MGKGREVCDTYDHMSIKEDSQEGVVCVLYCPEAEQRATTEERTLEFTRFTWKTRGLTTAQPM